MLSKDKKAVSVMIGYILLVAIAIVIGVLVFQWMKTYVPTDSLECPDGASLFIQSLNYYSDISVLNLTLKNNGRFDIAGYFIYAGVEGDDLANVDLTSFYNGTGFRLKSGIKISGGEVNSFKTDFERLEEFNLFEQDIAEDIVFVEIVPIRYQEEKGKIRLVSCGNAKVRENVKEIVAIE